MGKPSRLKARQEEVSKYGTRYAQPDGSRKLYDRDKAPDGTDTDVWHLVLLFEQLAEASKVSAEPRPIAYTELFHRIKASGIRDNDDWIARLEDMIRKYWHDTTATRNFINNFCTVEMFDYCRSWVADTWDRQELIASGRKRAEPEREQVGPAVAPNEVVTIMSREYSPEEIERKLREFRDRA